jgi:hypothetical protein
LGVEVWVEIIVSHVRDVKESIGDGTCEVQKVEQIEIVDEYKACDWKVEREATRWSERLRFEREGEVEERIYGCGQESWRERVGQSQMLPRREPV